MAAAEAEAQAARQQAAAAQAQVAEADAAAERARGDAQAAQAAARKLETDLEDLSAAYSTLDAHAGSLQQQLDALQAELAAARQQQAASSSAGAAAAAGGGISEDEVERRVAAARSEAAAEAQAEADEAMTDLLVCLGQEEAKVGWVGGLGAGQLQELHVWGWGEAALSFPLRRRRTGSIPTAFVNRQHSRPAFPPMQVARLRQRLEAFGVDVDALVADIVAAGEAGEAEQLGDDLT